MKFLPLIILVSLFLLSTVVSAAPNKVLAHDIKIANIIISEQSLRCNKEILALVDVENKGTYTENAYVELVNRPLGIHAFSPTLQVSPRSREQILFPLYLQEEPQGEYTFDAYLYSGKEIQQAFETFTFSGCKTVQLTSYIQAQSPMKIPVQSPPAVQENAVDFLLVSTLLIVAFLLLTASAALVRSF